MKPCDVPLCPRCNLARITRSTLVDGRVLELRWCWCDYNHVLYQARQNLLHQRWVNTTQEISQPVGLGENYLIVPEEENYLIAPEEDTI